MTVEEALAELERRGEAKVRALNARNGAPANQFGVRMGEIRTIAKAIKTDHALGLQLWQTGNADARLLAILLLRPRNLSDSQLEEMVAAATFVQLADWLNSYVVKQHPQKEALRQRWMRADDPWLARAGWSLTAERVSKSPDGLDLEALLERIERELGAAPEPTQWTMNGCLATIGIEFVGHRERALAIGERLGVYRDYPCSRGCTSPFAPIWIREMVSRQARN
ncbi:MAG: DNA alkylation repair protein [Armatimonadetes bacterium]|nr:DNA alkylation repair protein [Armatimonadota bacterium]